MSRTFWYLATPYSKYPGGLGEACKIACEATGLLITAGVPVFSPIAHTHPVAMACGMNPLDHKIWMPADEPIMAAAHGIIVLCADTWELSYGIGVQIDAFTAAGKPVVFMQPGVLPALPTIGAPPRVRDLVALAP